MNIRAHYGHEIVVAQYQDENGQAANYALECVECFEVLADEEVNA
jgi:hypothetical protein